MEFVLVLGFIWLGCLRVDEIEFSTRLESPFVFSLACQRTGTMKSLRRSLGDKSKADPHPHPSSSPGFVPSLSKPSSSIQPPKKVIRAIDHHSSNSPSELPFAKGDFFYVVGEKDDMKGGPGFYEALSKAFLFGLLLCFPFFSSLSFSSCFFFLFFSDD